MHASVFYFIFFPVYFVSIAFTELSICLSCMHSTRGLYSRARLGPLLFVSPLDFFYFYIWNRIFHGRTRRVVEYRAEVVGFIIRFLLWSLSLSLSFSGFACTVTRKSSYTKHSTSNGFAHETLKAALVSAQNVAKCWARSCLRTLPRGTCTEQRSLCSTVLFPIAWGLPTGTGFIFRLLFCMNFIEISTSTSHFPFALCGFVRSLPFFRTFNESSLINHLPQRGSTFTPARIRFRTLFRYSFSGFSTLSHNFEIPTTKAREPFNSFSTPRSQAFITLLIFIAFNHSLLPLFESSSEQSTPDHQQISPKLRNHPTLGTLNHRFENNPTKSREWLQLRPSDEPLFALTHPAQHSDEYWPSIAPVRRIKIESIIKTAEWTSTLSPNEPRRGTKRGKGGPPVCLLSSGRTTMQDGSHSFAHFFSRAHARDRLTLLALKKTTATLAVHITLVVGEESATLVV